MSWKHFHGDISAWQDINRASIPPCAAKDYHSEGNGMKTSAVVNTPLLVFCFEAKREITQEVKHFNCYDAK